MPRAHRSAVLAAATPAILAVGLLATHVLGERDAGAQALAADTPAAAEARIRIDYPAEGTLFPPDSVAPTVLWTDETGHVDRWNVVVRDDTGSDVLTTSVDAPRWRPSEDEWKRIKERSGERDAEVAVAGIDQTNPAKTLSSARVHLRTSKDPVGDALFYREGALRFSGRAGSVPDPVALRTIDEEPARRSCSEPARLRELPLVRGQRQRPRLDVDYGNDKGAYAVMDVSKHMVMDDAKIMTWADYKREDGELTFGLLSRVSPTGRYVISTVKDRSVFVAIPDLMISQLFFPIKGILVVYDREKKTYAALPGADDPQYVQSNAVWSPDEKSIVFARTKAYRAERLEQQNSALVNEKDVPEFTVDKKPFLYDLYRIPFNGGKGGTPEPLRGASGDGMSHYFPKYSPDGKWIIFCKAKSYMLLQPDSDLYIIPAEGGAARRLRYNTARMNSWHSWSSNSRWLVFSRR
jgi:hypothetical protein